MKFLKRLDIFTYEGSLTRGEFLSIYFFIAIPTALIGFFAVMTASQVLAWLLWSVYFFNAIILIFLGIRRLRDINFSPYWLFFLLMPFFNVYIIYLLFLKKKA